jgi:hypothetical protein
VCIAVEHVGLLEIRKEDSCLLERDAVLLGSGTVRIHCLTLRMEALWSFQTLETTSPMRQHYITEDFNLEQHCCENLISHKLRPVPWNVVTVIATHTHTGMISWTCIVIISCVICVGHFPEFLCCSEAHIAVLGSHLCLCWCLACLSPCKIALSVCRYLIGW